MIEIETQGGGRTVVRSPPVCFQRNLSQRWPHMECYQFLTNCYHHKYFYKYCHLYPGLQTVVDNLTKAEKVITNLCPQNIQSVATMPS